MQMVGQDHDGFDGERMAPPNISEGFAQEIDVVDEKTQAALGQIDREEKAAAADEISSIVRHRASMAWLRKDGFRCRSTHPTGWACFQSETDMIPRPEPD